MQTPARIKDHPIHPMLIAFPIGLWGFSFACDLLSGKGARKRHWRKAARSSMGAGIVTAVGAAVPGFIDYLSIRDPQIQKIATTHMALNLASVASYTYNYSLRKRRRSLRFPITLSAITMGMLCVSGWLGGHMVYKHRVGVVEPHERELEASMRQADMLKQSEIATGPHPR